LKPHLAIDPGASGGVAWRDGEGRVDAAPMPEGMTAQVDFLRALAARLPGVEAVLEKVGWWMPGDHPNSACRFARHCGNLEAALYALGIPAVAVAPATWMKALGALPKDKRARKAAIRELMARRYPNLSVTLRTADALGLLSAGLPTTEVEPHP
jgi:hypothetical protein